MVGRKIAEAMNGEDAGNYEKMQQGAITTK
jgi:hypothetical protein